MATHFSFKPGCAVQAFHGAAGDEYIIETPDTRRFKVSGMALRLLEQLDQGASVEDLSGQFTGMASDDLRSFILSNYGEFLVNDSGEVFATAGLRPKAEAKSGLLVAWTIIPRAATAKISSFLSFLYAPIVSALILLGILASHLAIYSSHGLAPARLAGAHASVVVLLCIASILAHELGHSSALARYGGSPSSIGFGLYLLLPVFYADVSQTWKLRQWQRVVVDMGGVYFQQLFFLPTALLALILRDPSLRAVCVAIDVMTLIALNPALRFDGYWVITDWLGLSNLHRSAAAYLRGLIRSIASRKSADSDYPKHLGKAKGAVFILYAVLSNVFMALLIILNFQWVRSAAMGLWSGLPELGLDLFNAIAQGHWVRSADLAVACAFLIASGATLLIGVLFQTRAVVQMARNRFSGANREGSRA